MATKETIISFRGEDNGLSSSLEKMRSIFNKFGEEISSNSLKTSLASKNTIKQIDEEIKAFERRSRAFNLSKKEELYNQYQHKISPKSEAEKATLITQRDAEIANTKGFDKHIAIKKKYENLMADPTDAIRGGAKLDYENQVKELDNETKKQSVLLRDLIDEVKYSALNQVREHKKDSDEQIAAFESGKLQNSPITEQVAAKVIKDVVDSTRKSGGGGGGGSSEGVSGEGEKGESGHGGTSIKNIALGVALGEVVGGILKKVGNAVTGFGSQFANATDPSFIAASVMGSIWEPLGEGKRRNIEEHEALERSTFGIRALTGNKRGNEFGASEYGYSMSETIPIGQQLAKSRAYGGANIGAETKELLSLEKAYSLDRNTLMGMGAMSGFDINKGGQLSNASNLIARNFSGPNPDMTKLSSLLEAQLALMEEDSNTLENIDSRQEANVVSNFASLGGSYAGPRGARNVVHDDTALSNPQGEFQQARNYSVLAKLNPKASYYEIKKMEEEGATVPGFMIGILKSIQKQFGSGELGQEMTRQRFGKTYSQGETLWKGFLENPDFMESTTNQSENLSKGQIEASARAATTEMDVNKAMFKDAFSEGMEEGMLAVAKKFGEKVASVIESTLTTMGMTPKGAKK